MLEPTGLHAQVGNRTGVQLVAIIKMPLDVLTLVGCQPSTTTGHTNRPLNCRTHRSAHWEEPTDLRHLSTPTEHRATESLNSSSEASLQGVEGDGAPAAACSQLGSRSPTVQTRACRCHGRGNLAQVFNCWFTASTGPHGVGSLCQLVCTGLVRCAG